LRIATEASATSDEDIDPPPLDDSEILHENDTIPAKARSENEPGCIFDDVDTEEDEEDE
jgi:hypothetical protein